MRSLVSLPLLLVAACSADDGSLGRPNVTIEPANPIALQFVNPTDDDVYVDFSDLQPAFVVSRGTTELITRRECLPFCGEGCACTSCTPPTGRVRRIAAGETWIVNWEPIHYAVNTCGGGSDCSCVENWPITAGQYQLELTGFTNAVGGTVSATNPHVIEGAAPGDLSVGCSAKGKFELTGGNIEVEATFTCP